MSFSNQGTQVSNKMDNGNWETLASKWEQIAAYKTYDEFELNGVKHLLLPGYVVMISEQGDGDKGSQIYTRYFVADRELNLLQIIKPKTKLRPNIRVVLGHLISVTEITDDIVYVVFGADIYSEITVCSRSALDIPSPLFGSKRKRIEQ